MNDPLRDALSIEVLHLFEQLDVLHQQGATRPGGEGILVVGDRGAVGGGKNGVFFVFRHVVF